MNLLRNTFPPGGIILTVQILYNYTAREFFVAEAPPPAPDLRPRRRPEIPVGRQRWAALPSPLLSAVF